MTLPKFKVGDFALHRSNTLDERPVEEVSDDGKQIKLRIGTYVTGWLPARNYWRCPVRREADHG